MAARLRVRHQNDIREKIRAGLLVKRLEDHVVEDVPMADSQVRAALGLLKKIVPDLQAVENSGDPDAPMHMVIGWANPQSK